MASLSESRAILVFSAILVAAAHAAILFAWAPAANTPGILMDDSSPGLEVDLVALADQNAAEVTAPVEETLVSEPVAPPTPELTPVPEPIPAPQESEPAQEPPEHVPEAENQPIRLATLTPPRTTPRATVIKPKETTKAMAGNSGASLQAGGAPSGGGAPVGSASLAAFAKKPSLIYPAESRQAGEEGTVIVRITVDSQGRPTQVFLVKGSGYTRLDRAALEGSWRCKIRNAKAGMILDIPLRFDLND